MKAPMTDILQTKTCAIAGNHDAEETQTPETRDRGIDLIGVHRGLHFVVQCTVDPEESAQAR